MTNFWDERYTSNDFVYGTAPNHFFKEQIGNLKPGKILMLGEGEGRNAVYAAKLGWNVDAVDLSYVAKQKALKFSEQNGVSINYFTSDVFSYKFPKSEYDAVGIIFLHMNEAESKRLYELCSESLKKNGRIVLELFSKNQLGKKSGGPQDLSLLSSIKQIEKYFNQLKHEFLREENIFLAESKFHQGEASVIRYVGVK